jgi:thiol:disulfide interchange protein DsbD|tara:strand:- start:7666 stop:9378 length:1713 start_codon:yes stop_codon:yes gene_type:complete
MFTQKIYQLLFLVFAFTSAAVASDDIFAPKDNIFSNQIDFLPVEKAYQIMPSIGPEGASFYWTIAPEYYLYKHAFKVELNNIDITNGLKIADGLPKTDEYFGDVEVYYQQAMIVTPPIAAQDKLVLTVSSQGCADAGLCYPPRQQYFTISADLTTITELDRPPSSALDNSDANQVDTPITLIIAMAMAFVGGLILNLMPCVLPVLTLKVLSFSRQTNSRQLKLQAWAYTAGVIASFVFIAALLIALKASGQAIGWGFQLQSAWFVGALVYLFFVLGLGMFGSLELGSSFMGAGQAATEQGGAKGSFFTGVLATVVASPCTAPFMGTALGFAVAQDWYTALLVFAFLGAGMAFPFLLLSYWPKLQQYLPKPGQWMERFKQFMAFPLWATAIWLLTVVTAQAGSLGMAIILCGCLLIAMAIWFKGSLGGGILKIVFAAIAIGLLLSPQLRLENKPIQNNLSNTYSPNRLSQLRSEGKAVFINVTADWCITCKVNEQIVLGTQEFEDAVKINDVSYIIADWTSYDPEISTLLAQYRRTGIPLYLLFPKNSTEKARVLPQLLTKDVVISALNSL